MKKNSIKITGKDSIRVKTRFGVTDYSGINLDKIDLTKPIPKVIEQLENQ
jgi:hypothetical protein